MAFFAAKPKTAQARDRVVRAPVHAVWTGGDVQAVLTPGATAPLLLPVFVADFLEACQEFRPLEDHLRHYAQARRLNQRQWEALVPWSRELLAAGLLLSEHALIRQLAAESPPPSSPPPVAALGIPTGGRPAMLMRTLAGFLDNAQRHGHDPEFVVADNSTDPVCAAEIRRQLQELARRTGARIFYAGNADRHAFARKLGARCGVAPATLDFALSNVHHVPFAAGINRNVLALHNVGRLYVTVDDDVLCRLVAPPQTVPGPRFSADHSALCKRFYPTREAALEAAQFEDADFLGLHEAWLGHALSDKVRAAEGCRFESVHDGMVRRLARGSCSVIATYTSILLDPGTPTSCYHLFASGQALDALAPDDAFYEAAMRSRSTHSFAPCVLLADGGASPAMAWGFDHRDLLPPFFPVFHAEDLSYGPLALRCCPRGFSAWLPYAVVHDPGPGKLWLHPADLQGAQRAVVFEFAQLFRDLLLRRPLADACLDRACRMQTLGRDLRLLGSLVPADFYEFLRVETLDLAARHLLFFENLLLTETDRPAAWRRDVEHLVTQMRDALEHDDFDIPWDLKPLGEPPAIRALMQSLIREYGALLEAWPSIHAAAVDLASEGERIGSPVDTRVENRF